MKNVTIVLLFLFPFSLFSKSEKNDFQSLLEKSINYQKQALFVQSLKICQTSLADMKGKHKYYPDFILLKAENLYYLERPNEAISILKANIKYFSKYKKKKDLRFLKYLNILIKSHYRQSACVDMLANLEKAIELYEGKTTHNYLAETYDFFGNYWGESGQREEASSYFEKAKKIRLMNKSKEPLSLVYSLMSFSVVQNIIGNYDNAIDLLNEALDITKKNEGNYYQKAQLLLAIGKSHSNRMDYEAAIRNINQAEKYLQQHRDDSYFLMTDIYAAKGMNYRASGQKDSSIFYFNKVIDSLKNHTSVMSKVRLGVAQHNFALLFSATGEFDKTHALLNQAAENFAKGSQSETCDWSVLQRNQINITRSNTFYNEGKYERAIEAYKDNIQNIRENIGDDSPNLPQALQNLGLTYYSLGQYDKADTYYDEALAIFKQNPYQKISFDEIPSTLEYAYILWNKADNFHWKYKEKGDVKNLKEALHFYDLYTQFIDYTRSGYQDEATKIGFAGENKVAYEKCIEIIYELQKIEPDENLKKKAYEYLEKSKSLILLEAIKSSQINSFEGVPSLINQREEQLRFQARYARTRFDNVGRRNPDKISQLETDLFKAKSEFYNFLDTLKNNYPAYYNLKYSTEVVSLGYIQDTLLQGQQSVVQYYDGDENIYIFFIDKNHYEIKQIPKDFPLKDWVSKLRTGISSYYSSGVRLQTSELYKESIESYIEHSQKLYQKLISPIESLLKKGEQIYFIPDEDLANLPFETLLESTPEYIAYFDSYPFLIRKHPISYCYSLSLLKQMKSKIHQRKDTKDILALAPFIGKNTAPINTRTEQTFTRLPYSEEEVNSIAQSSRDGKILLGKEASKATFKKIASDFRIIHFSTHAKADASLAVNSYLAFSGETGKDVTTKLFLPELYVMQLNADMVVLSGCETNLGELKTGEGIMSLARGFAYAGAKSVLASLWKVEDKNSKDLAILFYQNLKNDNKSKALQRAKIALLDRPDNYLKHPFFWAAMVSIGDISKIE